MKRAALALALLLGTLVVWAETLHIADPLLALASPDETRKVARDLDRAIIAAQQSLERYATVRTGGQAGAVRADATITTVAYDSGNGPGISMTYTGSNGSNGIYNFASQLGPNTAQELANGIIYLHLSYGEEIEPDGEPPALLAALSSRDLQAESVGPAADLRIQSVDAGPSGQLLLSLGTQVYLTDSSFRRLSSLGGTLTSRFESFAYRSFLGEGDQTVTLASTLADVYRIPYPGAEPTRVPLGGYQAMSGALLSDGTLALQDVSNQVVVLLSLDDELSELPLRGTFDVFPQLIAAGPAGSIWTWDAVQRSVSVWSRDGTRLTTVLPLLPPEESAVTLMVPYPDGSFVVSGNQGLYKFDRSGVPQWILPWTRVPGIRNATGIMIGTFDKTNGLLYLVNVVNGSVYQLLDREYAKRYAGVTPRQRQIITFQQQLTDEPGNAEALTALARMFEDDEAWELAAHYWREARDRNRSNAAFAAGAARIEVQLLWREARSAIELATQQLERFGPANARAEYNRALRLLEQILALSPENEQALDSRSGLEALYAQQFAPLELSSVAVNEIFPSLIQQLQVESIGEVIIRNPNQTSAVNVRVEARLAEFMEQSWQSATVSSLPAGALRSFAIRLPVERSILNLNARLVNAPLRLTVRYEIEGQPREISFTEGVTVHPVTALTWEDSGKLATYVTPADTYVNRFSSLFTAVDRRASEWGVARNFLRAARLADAVGSHGIEYIQDPNLGIATILGDPSVVDSVQLPRTTLWFRRGDCDDTTALLASVFESVSISTAIMTSPDHVFLAFDSGQPEQDAWMFESESTVAIPHEGTLWIPFETTILDQGFLASWSEGSRLVRRYGSQRSREIPSNKDDQIEFLPVSGERERYPELPVDALEREVFQFLSPLPERVSELHNESVGDIRRVLYSQSLASLEQNLRSQSAQRALRTLNQIGVLHAQFGEHREAKAAFQRALAGDDSYVPTYLNLANLALIQDSAREAIVYVDQADDLRRPGVLSTLIRAQALFALGDVQEARTRMGLVEQEAPELAALYPHLSGEAGARASDAAARGLIPWAIEGDE